MQILGLGPLNRMGLILYSHGPFQVHHSPLVEKGSSPSLVVYHHDMEIDPRH